MANRNLWLSLAGDIAFALLAAFLIASTLGIDLLNSDNWPTGGDSASHLLYAWLYADELLFSGQVTPWIPEVFGGLPFLSYYFPLPFIVIAVLSKVIGFAPAFKWGSFLAEMLLPGAVYAGSRRWLGFSWMPAFCGALGALAFVLHEQNSIWGGNLLSTLAGEFAYGYGLLFAVLALMAWARAVSMGRGWITAGVIEAACGFSHGFPLLVVGFSTLFLLFESNSWQIVRRTLGLLVRGHLLAFCLLGGWLWPMLEMHNLTIPNDASFPLSTWQDLLPQTLWPSLAAGLSGLLLLLVPRVRNTWSDTQISASRYFISAAGLAAVGFVIGDQLGLADIRFMPLTWLLGAICCGWLVGQVLVAMEFKTNRHFGHRLPAFAHLLCAAACAALLGWLGQHVREAPDWARWNHSGLQAKPQWHNLTQLLPAMRGDLWSPRLLFEHDPANNDLGSTRTLEALPMFLNHRPVLEGLYMESGLLGPAVYQVQSEISARPSSPLVRFPGGSLDPQFAALHMNLLHADSLLLRSEKAKSAIEDSGLFEKSVEALPFALYRLRNFDSQLVQVVRQPIRIKPMQDWMQDSFDWFRTRSRFNAYQPVYGEGLSDKAEEPGQNAPRVNLRQLSRNTLEFSTEAVGRPHLVKIAYHPRWQLESRGSIHIAAPGFMLVVPQEREVRLIYGHTMIGKLGMMATTIAAMCVVLFGLNYSRRQPPAPVPLTEVKTGSRWRRWMPLLSGWLILVSGAAYFAFNSAERHYAQAWKQMNAGRHEQAGEQFRHAYQMRNSPAKKEEALFWLAKASELSGNTSAATSRYRELCEHFHGYWLPESLYTLVRLERQAGADAETEARRLREEFPGNPWTLKLDRP